MSTTAVDPAPAAAVAFAVIFRKSNVGVPPPGFASHTCIKSKFTVNPRHHTRAGWYVSSCMH